MQLDEYFDPTTAPFWEAAQAGKLLIQKCGACGHFQFYPRPICLACEMRKPLWVEACGDGTVYSMTTVRTSVTPDLKPPYVVGLVELTEGVRMLGGILGPEPSIGARVRLDWRQRAGLPPVPVFRLSNGG